MELDTFTNNGMRITISQAGFFIEPNLLNLKRFNDVSICRPTRGAEMRYRDEATANLVGRYPVGVYKNAKQINEILQHQVAFFESRFDAAIRKLASREFLDFILDQYDCASKVQDMLLKEQLSSSDKEYWLENECIIRRALKFIAERIVLLNPGEDGSYERDRYIDYSDTVFIYAEEIVRLSTLSDQTIYLFPSQTEFEVSPNDTSNFYSLQLTDPDLVDFLTEEHAKRITRDAQIRHQFFDGKPFYLDVDKHDKIIGTAFEQMCGVRYKLALQVLQTIPTICRPAKDNFPICFIQKQGLVEDLASRAETSAESIQKILAGFSLTPENLAEEHRHFFNPKNEYRAYRRGFFEVQHPTGLHLTWSNSMFFESLHMLILGISHGVLPPEWKHPALIKAMGDLVREGGKWFENVVKNQLTQLGFEVLCSRKAVGKNPNRLELPFEIDIIAYHQPSQLLLIQECKMVLGGAEPKTMRDEIHDFVKKKNSHTTKLSEKMNWIRQNLISFVNALESDDQFKHEIKANSLAHVIITFYPSFASHFTSDIPCVSLSEFITDWQNNNGKYPYSKGVESISI